VDVLSPITSALAAQVSVQSRALLDGPWSARFIGGPPLLFHVLERGTGFVRIDGEPPIPLSEGDIVLVRPGIDHIVSRHADTAPQIAVDPAGWIPGLAVVDRWYARAVDEVLVCGRIDLIDPASHPLLGTLPVALHLRASPHEAGEDLARQLREIAREMETEEPGWETVVSQLSGALLVRILRLWLAQAPEQGFLPALAHPQVAQALAAMHRSPADRWTVASLATASSMSRSAFAATFASLVGEPPLAYLTRWRMTVACRGLRVERWSVGEAARSTGYRSEPAFSRAFRRSVGISPARYRRGSVAE
jgi:AraC-like DNA-binding protein